MNVVHEQPKDAEDIVRAGAGIVVTQLQAAGEANVGDEYKIPVKLHAELQIAWDYYPRIPHLMEVCMTTSASGANNPDQQQQQDLGWRLPQHRPMVRKEDQPVARREGLPWTGPAPQIGQDRWLPPSAYHQVDHMEWTLNTEDLKSILFTLLAKPAVMLLLLPDKLQPRLAATGQAGRRGPPSTSTQTSCACRCKRGLPGVTIVPQGSPGNPPGTTSTLSASSSLSMSRGSAWTGGSWS